MTHEKGQQAPTLAKEADNLTNKNEARHFRNHKTVAKNLKIQEVFAKDLPLACPMPKMTLWNAHPKVYLPIEETGQAICPYCNTEYVLKNIKT